MDNEAIIYPAEFAPSTSPIFIRNEIDINSTPEKVWHGLTNAKAWHQWYRNASRVMILNQYNDNLTTGTKFIWKTFGSRILCEVKEFVPYQRLAWTTKGRGILTYHAWLIIPTKTGCKLISEETQNGWMCKLGKMLKPNRAYNAYQIWLEGLKTKAEKS